MALRTSRPPALRGVLRAHPDGLTASELAQLVPGGRIDQRNVYRTLHMMPDAYIDRWTEGRNQRWRAVWCVVVPPGDCPRPGRYHERA